MDFMDKVTELSKKVGVGTEKAYKALGYSYNVGLFKEE